MGKSEKGGAGGSSTRANRISRPLIMTSQNRHACPISSRATFNHTSFLGRLLRGPANQDPGGRYGQSWRPCWDETFPQPCPAPACVSGSRGSGFSLTVWSTMWKPSLHHAGSVVPKEWVGTGGLTHNRTVCTTAGDSSSAAAAAAAY